MSQPKIKCGIGKYEFGRTIGEGTYVKLKFAQNSENEQPVAIKILDKDAVLKHKMAEQNKQEIEIMKLIKHPNVVRIEESENLLLDAAGNLKVSDFGLSALSQQDDGLLITCEKALTCPEANHVSHAKIDDLSCDVQSIKKITRLKDVAMLAISSQYVNFQFFLFKGFKKMSDAFDEEVDFELMISTGEYLKAVERRGVGE
ncbi:cbl-interacting protein kinase 32 [Phtheirospermum japonicum]|uniref:Cbl-interacting protein kinase 32 n=1 Tax=Phtheirospermum japonicum TaxID=374723 RepID=A0A830CZE2_9LAMI|nr:cbl-interacting protein kinase 32 [Phtheirospermum japonicum]